MTELPASENVAPPYSAFTIVSPTTNDSERKMLIYTSAEKCKAIDENIDFVVEEALECTAVISLSATTLETSATAGDESDTKPTFPDVAVPQSSLLSLNDGPTNHQVHVNYIATQSDATTEQSLHPYRRSKSTGNLPNQSPLLKLDGGTENLPEISNNVSSEATGAASSSSHNNTFTGWLVSGNDIYSCDVGNTIEAITTIAFPGSPDHITTKGPENDADETSSIGSNSSVAYFDPSDFDSSTWRNVVWNHASTTAFGIVTVIALATTAIAHPLFFLAASALAAVGTVTAAITHRGTASASQSSVDLVANMNDKYAVDGKTIETTSVTSTAESSWSTWLCFDNPFQTRNDDIPKSIDQSQTVVKLHELSTVEVGGATKALSRTNAETSPVTRRKLSNEDQTAWVQKHFPRLAHSVGPSRSGNNKNPTSPSASLVGLNSVDCFRVFFDDAAPYNFLALQEKRGDLHIQYGLWNNLPMVGKISMFDHKDSLTFPKNTLIQSYQGRVLTFHAKTNAMFGPPYAKTTKIQRLLLVNRRLAILENKTTLSGIPFSDRFYVGERWIFTSEKVENQHYVTHVQVDCEVFFHHGSCPFEQQIKSKSISTINEVVSSWCIMAVEALKLTERAKLDRLQRTMDDDDADDETIDELPTAENMETETNKNLNREDAIEVVADASLLLRRNYVTTNHRPRGTLRGIKHFGRHRHSFDDGCAVTK